MPPERDAFEARTSTTSIRCSEDDMVVGLLGPPTSLSITTLRCNRLTVEAPLADHVLPGEVFELRLLHFTLLPLAEEDGYVASRSTRTHDLLPSERPSQHQLLSADIP